MILKFISNVTNLDQVSHDYKLLFLMTNIIYFLPIVLYGWNRVTVIISLIGLISLIYHSYQCKCSTKPICKYLLRTDCIGGSILTLILFYLTPPDMNILPFGLLAFIFLLKGNNDRSKKTYLFLHSMWHFLTGAIFLYLAQKFSEK